MQNGFVEKFNRTYRQDILDAHLFEEITRGRILTEQRIMDYHQEMLHEALGGMTPELYEMQYFKEKIVHQNNRKVV